MDVNWQKLLWPNEDDDRSVLQPQAVARRYMIEVAQMFPEVLGADDSRFFFQMTGDYPAFNALHSATSGECLGYDAEPLIEEGWRPVCDGRRPFGGALERFLTAFYWFEFFSRDHDTPDPEDLFCAGFLLGAAVQELSEHPGRSGDEFIASSWASGEPWRDVERQAEHASADQAAP